MGHIRLGRLPKTRPWSKVLALFDGASISPEILAQATVTAAQAQFARLQGDPSVNYCFWVLVRLATAARGDDFAGELRRLGIQNPQVTSGIAFVQQISQMVEHELQKRGQPTVFTHMAVLSLREVLSANIIEQSRSLFGTSVADIQAACRTFSTRRRFGEAAKTFFARFTSRSLQFVLDKEVSNYVGPDHPFPSSNHVLAFQQAMQHYCLETAKIVEDFAAGWFSKHNWESNNNISEETTATFTAYAFEKIQMELREARM